MRTDKTSGRKTYGMLNNELFLWLLCRPELVPVVDFFYFPEDRAERLWYRLLNRGYTLACSASSDAAFDVGRSPGSSHATYAQLDHVDGASIVSAFKAGRTMVSYLGNAVLLDVDGRTSGAVLDPGEGRRRLKVDAYATPGRTFVVRVIRNGAVFVERRFVAPEDGRYSLSMDFVEKGNAWYVATLREVEEEKSAIRAVASPLYFRDDTYHAPETVPLTLPLPKKIKQRLLYLTPEEADTDSWYEELRQMLKQAAEGGLEE